MSAARLLFVVLFLCGAAGAFYFAREAGRGEPARDPASVPAAPEPVVLPSGGREPAATWRPPADEPEDAGERWTELNRQAIEDLQAGDYEAAIAGFEACMQAVPDEPVFGRNLAEALARLARREHEAFELDAAIARLGRAVELAPQREDLALLLARWREAEETEQHFWREESEHFAYAYDGDRAEILHGGHVLIEELERAYLDFGEHFNRFPVEAGSAKIRVVLYRREEFDAITGLGHWAGGVFDGTVRVPVADLAQERPKLVRVLRHELLHAFVREVGGRGVPGWLNEGLAQRHEWTDPATRRAVLDAAKKKLEGGPRFPLERLQKSLASWKDPDEIRRAYAQSLWMVAEIAERFGERVPFEMVAGCGKDESPAESLRRLAGADLVELVASLGN